MKCPWCDAHYVTRAELEEHERSCRRRAPEILDRGWYVSSTLLAGTPDCNQRFLHFRGETIRAYNVDRSPWPADKDQALQRACDLLNGLEGIAPGTPTPHA